MKEANVDLLEKILKGNAIALIGSGPSSAMGYPSWSELAKKHMRLPNKRDMNLMKNHSNSISKRKNILMHSVVCKIPSREKIC